VEHGVRLKNGNGIAQTMSKCMDAGGVSPGPIPLVLSAKCVHINRHAFTVKSGMSTDVHDHKSAKGLRRDVVALTQQHSTDSTIEAISIPFDTRDRHTMAIAQLDGVSLHPNSRVDTTGVKVTIGTSNAARHEVVTKRQGRENTPAGGNEHAPSSHPNPGIAAVAWNSPLALGR
jgi:hypothetical protein